MSDEHVGDFEYRGRTFRFCHALCTWRPGGELTVEAEGDRCWLRLVGVPFPATREVAELPGRRWEPHDDELAAYADTFAEGGLGVRGKQLWIMSGQVKCLRFDAGRGVLTLSFRLDVQDSEYGRADEADGTLSALVDG